MRYFKLLSGAALFGAMALSATPSAATCSGTYCTQGTSSSYSSGAATMYAANPVSSYSNYSSPSSYSGSYSTSSSLSGLSLASTGYSAGYADDLPAGMCPTTCPVSVDAPAGSRVLACYAACPTIEIAPAPVYVAPPVQMSYRVVRPIIAVPYPVPVWIPNTCGPIIDAPSRYGSRYGYSTCGR